MIEVRLREELGFDVPVFLRTVPELESLFALDIFQGREVRPDMRLAVTFASSMLPQNLELPLFSAKRDMELVSVIEQEAFVVWYIVNGQPPADGFLEKMTGKRTTARFYHTLRKILDAAQGG